MGLEGSYSEYCENFREISWTTLTFCYTHRVTGVHRSGVLRCDHVVVSHAGRLERATAASEN